MSEFNPISIPTEAMPQEAEPANAKLADAVLYKARPKLKVQRMGRVDVVSLI